MDWKFALSSADEAPLCAPILLRGNICENLRKAAKLGYDGLEVHTRETAEVDINRIKATCEETGVKIASLVTGRLNTEGKCNLMDDVPYVMNAAIEGMKKYIDLAAELETDIIIGWVKGNVPEGKTREKYLSRLGKNIGILSEYANVKKVRLNLEVINRYEVNVFTTAKETLEFINRHDLKNCFVHLDTFHMNIEEKDSVEAIKMCGKQLGYIHFADNNRCYPGSGQIDFRKIIKSLKEINYQGYLAVECLPYPDSDTAAIEALECLKEYY